MERIIREACPTLGLLMGLFLFAPLLCAGKSDVMGELRFEGRSGVEKSSGVWIDSQYVGYLKELRGSKKILLLPGEHTVTVRQDGYQEFTARVSVQPKQKLVVKVAMAKAPTAPLPLVKAEVKLDVNPSRAAVFVDGLYVGHAKEFEGMGRGMLVVPGDHQISIALPGYQAFETSIKALGNQKVVVKTDLLKGSGSLAGPLVNNEDNQSTQPVGAPDATSAQAR
jgi:hypothetical protein